MGPSQSDRHTVSKRRKTSSGPFALTLSSLRGNRVGELIDHVEGLKRGVGEAARSSVAASR